jgi:hypothetical protein
MNATISKSPVKTPVNKDIDILRYHYPGKDHPERKISAEPLEKTEFEIAIDCLLLDKSNS